MTWDTTPQSTSHLLTVVVNDARIRLVVAHQVLVQRGPQYEAFLDRVTAQVIEAKTTTPVTRASAHVTH